jgi:hypothetical protein
MRHLTLIALLAALLTACADDAPPPTATPIAMIDAPASIELINTRDETVCYAYIAPYFETEWGPDLLPGTIPAEDSEVLEMEAGVYDGLVEFCNGEEVSIFGLILDGPGEVWRIGVDDVTNYAEPSDEMVNAATLTVVNDSPTTICQFYLVASGEPGWDRPRFRDASEGIAPGERRVFTVAPGGYNLRADSCEAAYGEGAQPVGVWEERAFTVGEGGAEWVLSP